MVRGPQGVSALRTVGGLAGALDDALRLHGGTWIAWAGQHVPDELLPETTGLAYPIRPVRLKEREVSAATAGAPPFSINGSAMDLWRINTVAASSPKRATCAIPCGRLSTHATADSP